MTVMFVAYIVLLLTFPNEALFSTSFHQQNRVVPVDESVHFFCSPNSTDLYRLEPVGGSNFSLVPLKKNFSFNLSEVVHDNQLWSASLTKTAVVWTKSFVNLNDSGKYFCFEPNTTAAEPMSLTVTETMPNCYVAQGNNQTEDTDKECNDGSSGSSSQTSQNSTIYCSLTFSGDVIPVMKWKITGQRSSISPSYYELKSSGMTVSVLGSPGRQYICMASFQNSHLVLSRPCDTASRRQCAEDGGEKENEVRRTLIQSYRIVVVASAVVIFIVISLCVFYVIAFVWFNWRSPVHPRRRIEEFKVDPIMKLTEISDSLSELEDVDSSRKVLGGRSPKCETIVVDSNC